MLISNTMDAHWAMNLQRRFSNRHRADWKVGGTAGSWRMPGAESGAGLSWRLWGRLWLENWRPFRWQ